MKKILFIVMMCFSIIGQAQVLAPNGIKVDKGGAAVTLSNTELKTLDGNTTNINTGYLKVADADSAAYYTAGEVDAKTQTNFILIAQWNPSSLTDAATYYYGSLGSIGGSTSEGGHKWLIPADCTLIGFAKVLRSTGAASSEASTLYIRKNATSDDELSNAIIFGGAFEVKYANSLTLNINYSKGDFIELKMVTPSWVTNPTTMNMETILYFKTR